MPLVHVLTTGGTISTKIDHSLGVAFATGTRDLVSKASVSGVEVQVREIFQKGSSRITPNDWILMADRIVESLRQGVDGVVLLHGTDTMQYTSAALSFMIRDLNAPIVLTGSMIPGNEPDSDSLSNVQAAIRTAAYADLAEVCVVFSAEEKGSTKTIIRGTRVKKVCSTALNAFASINAPQLGTVRGEVIELSAALVHRSLKSASAKTTLNSRVCLIKQFPSLTHHSLKNMLADFEGAVYEGTGLGHIRPDLHQAIKEFGKPTVITTQCVRGGEKLGRYDTDKQVLEITNIIPTADMLPEVALVKLMWILGQTSKLEKVKEAMLTPLAGEIRTSTS